MGDEVKKVPWYVAAWLWIVQAAKDVYSLAWAILGVLRDKTGKFSFKRVSGAVALFAGLDYLARGAKWEALACGIYAGIVTIIAAVTGT